jgi:hypothetical protein
VNVKIEETEYKLSKEAATDVFQGILDFYDIDFEDIVNDQGAEAAKTLRNKFIRAIRKGRIETNLHEDSQKGFQIIQHTMDDKEFAYNEYNAKAAEESDKGRGVSAAQYRLLGSLSGKGEAVKKMRGPDLKLAEYIAVLFLL